MKLTWQAWLTEFKRLLQRFEPQAIKSLDFSNVEVHVNDADYQIQSSNYKIISCKIEEANSFI